MNKTTLLKNLKDLHLFKFMCDVMTNDLMQAQPEDIIYIRSNLIKMGVVLNYNPKNTDYTDELTYLIDIIEIQLYKTTVLLNNPHTQGLSILYNIDNKLAWINEQYDYEQLKELSIYLYGFLPAHTQKTYETELIFNNDYDKLYNLIKKTLNTQILKLEQHIKRDE